MDIANNKTTVINRRMMDIKKALNFSNLTFFAAIAVVCILPSYVYYLPPFMILWGIFWLLENKFSFNREMFTGNKSAILFALFIIFYFWQICGLLFADSANSGFERIIKRLSFLLFPLVLFYPGKKILNNIQLLLKLFAICTFLYIVYCYFSALYESVSISGRKLIFNPHPPILSYENYFIGYRLTYPLHPSYISMYIILSVIICLESVFTSSVTFMKRMLWLFFVIVLMIALFLLSSRAGLLAAIVILPVYVISKVYDKLPVWISIISVLIMISIFIGLAKTNDRINYTIEKVIAGSSLNDSFKTFSRHSIWDSALSVIKKNILFGVGTGDASNELKKEFISKGYSDGLYDNLNAHNQFLEVLLENGVIGLLVFLALFGYMVYLSVNQRNLIYGLFVILMLIFFIFETVLNRLAGITFFSLFSFLLIFYNGNHLKSNL
jgi:O-antigen ligase